MRGEDSGVIQCPLLLGKIMDLYSRKIVGSEVFLGESAANSQQVIERALLREGVAHRPIVLHGDNGPAMKAATLTARLDQLGVKPSYSRPRVSDDNPFSEALFRTCKYRPDYPPNGFADVHEARDWVLGFVRWYNHEHRHSSLRYVTPQERHEGRDQAILARRHAIYTAAKQANPRRWSGRTRNWEPVGAVWLNPEKALEAA
ncbi:transposase [Spiribacter onubensis]